MAFRATLRSLHRAHITHLHWGTGSTYHTLTHTQALFALAGKARRPPELSRNIGDELAVLDLADDSCALCVSWDSLEFGLDNLDVTFVSAS